MLRGAPKQSGTKLSELSEERRHLFEKAEKLFESISEAKYFKSTILASAYSSSASGGSTIGDEWLNFCVRDGNRCTPLSKNAKTVLLKLVPD